MSISIDFYHRPTLTVARELLSKILVRKFPDRSTSKHRITEVEAYDGPEDLASHASKGRTARTEIMFAPGGMWYVYLVYGMHHMLNIVTGEKNYPAAVLIRGVEDISGPGRLTKQLGIDKTLNCQPADESSVLWIEDDGFVVPEEQIITTSRVGVAYAKEWAEKPYRFVWEK